MAKLSDLRKEAEKEGSIGSGVYKVQEGDNKIRALTTPLPHNETYQGERRFKWLLYVLDRRDGAVKPYFMPHSIFKMVEALQESDDYAFEDFPMPMDITIRAKGAGTREVEYSVVPARKSVAITTDEQNALDAKQPIAEFQAKLREKASAGERFDPDTVGEVPI